MDIDEETVIRLNIFWIDPNVDNKENQTYLTLLKKHYIEKKADIEEDKKHLDLNPEDAKTKVYPYHIHQFKNVESAVEDIKTIKFKETIIIVSGRLFNDLVRLLQKNLNSIYVIPKIIVFTTQKKNYPFPKEVPNDLFYTYEGSKTSFEEIKSFIDTQLEKIEAYFQKGANAAIQRNPIGDKLIFEKIGDLNSSPLPEFYQKFLEETDSINNTEFIQYMYNNYNKEQSYKEMLSQMIDIPDIPVELLSKYYIRMYTSAGGNYYKYMKFDLLGDDEKIKLIYLPYIKTLYKGLEIGTLRTYTSFNVYGALKLSDQQIQDLSQYKQNGSLMFSRAFLTFSKIPEVTEIYMKYGKNAFATVSFSNINAGFYSHADLGELSVVPEEKEILFFPFSVFRIDDFKLDQVKQRYEIKLTCFGKLRRDIQNIITGGKKRDGTEGECCNLF